MTPAASGTDLEQASPAKMRAAWDRFARHDPMYHIHCGERNWDRDAFFASGSRRVKEWMSWIEQDVRKGRMLEIGCGLGRMTVAFAREFAQVDAVDISASMIEQARALGPPPNVRFHATSGSSLEAFESESFDFVASNRVFQHIPDEPVIAEYMREIARVLRPGGHAMLQLNTARSGIVRKLIYTLPDSLLPRTSRRYMRCYRRDPKRTRELIVTAGMKIDWERTPGSRSHYFFLQKPAAS